MTLAVCLLTNNAVINYSHYKKWPKKIEPSRVSAGWEQQEYFLPHGTIFTRRTASGMPLSNKEEKVRLSPPTNSDLFRVAAGRGDIIVMVFVFLGGGRSSCSGGLRGHAVRFGGRRLVVVVTSAAHPSGQIHRPPDTAGSGPPPGARSLSHLVLASPFPIPKNPPLPALVTMMTVAPSSLTPSQARAVPSSSAPRQTPIVNVPRRPLPTPPLPHPPPPHLSC